MKRNKWQRLAAIGLCSSLLVNAFSGVTAVAETVTIESSPTAESSVKEETQASSETQETTTETSREEVTQKTEKQAEVEVEKKEDTPVKAEQKEVEAQQEAQPTPQPPVEIQNRAVGVKAGNLPELHQQLVDLLYARYGSLGQLLGYQTDPIPFPEGVIGFNLKNTENVTLNMADFDLTATTRFTINENSPYKPISSVVGPTTVNKSATGFDLVVPAKTITATSNLNQFYHVEAVSLQVPAYIKQVSIAGSIVNIGYGTLEPRLTNVALIIAPTDSSHYDISSNFALGKYIYQIRDTSGKAESPTSYYATHGEAYVPANDIDLNVTFRKVTENFVDATGAKITPPTGFTQGQQTSITSNDFTYTSAKALPDTYKAGGKTYKFKGWYKGKTKPATLKTTKTPSYAVTYDDNDDLNVVYEEIEAFDFPAITYQFGFVDESGKQVDASKVSLTYDNWYGEVFSNNAADTNISANWKTVSLEKGQVAPTKNNLKEIVYPAQSLEILSGRTSQYSVANLTFALPKYYEKMSVYNKNGTFDAAYPFPSVQNNNSTIPIVEGSDKYVSKWFELKKSGSQSFVFNQTTPAAPTDVQVPAYLREIVHNPAIVANKGTYYTLDKPVYYYLTNRKVTENFVDTTGTKITAPTGFTQGNQIPMTSDTFKYTAAKALPASYSAGGKTYTFQG
ncbi:hypothetical protein ACPTIJ_03845 [Enterococcus faecalis]